MASGDVLRGLVAATPPAAAAVSVPAWGPPIVELFGANVPIASMVLALLGLAMARGVNSAREGRTKGGLYLTGTLALIVIGVVVERQPTPGIAVALGVGIGSSGILILDIFKDWVLDIFRRLREPRSQGIAREATSLLDTLPHDERSPDR